MNKNNHLQILYIIHSLSNCFFELIHFDDEKNMFSSATKQAPHFNKVHEQVDPELCRLFGMTDSHFQVQMCSEGSGGGGHSSSLKRANMALRTASL